MKQERMTGEQLRRLRKRAGMDRIGLAFLAGCHKETIARKERGDVAISRADAALFRVPFRGTRG